MHTLAYENSGSPALTVSRQYDSLNRLTSIQNETMSHSYQYNAASQRTRVDREDGSHWLFGYDGLGQVTSATRHWSGGEPVAGQLFHYSFDDVGNREKTMRNWRTANYQPNLLNQIEKRDVPGFVDIMGHAHPDATVTVNYQPTTRQEGGYFQKALSIDNEQTDAWEEVRTVGVRQETGPQGEDVVSEETGNVFLPASPESFVHDADGNLTRDGRWDYTWDGENRLISMETRTDLQSSLPWQRLEFVYDHQGRRAIKNVFNSPGSPTPDKEIHYVYQGWNPIAELDGATGSPIRTYAWGLDLSGGLAGAGGVGGLLMVTDEGEGETYYPCFDGNGNVTALVAGVDGSTAALYEYGPFGETIRATGTAAGVNPFRFSTKYQDAESGFYYYGYRFYNPDTGRWLNRDPIEEAGGPNLYGFVGNGPVQSYDFLGLYRINFTDRRVPLWTRVTRGWDTDTSPWTPHQIGIVQITHLNAIDRMLELGPWLTKYRNEIPKEYCPSNGRVILEYQVNYIRGTITALLSALISGRELDVSKATGATMGYAFTNRGRIWVNSGGGAQDFFNMGPNVRTGTFVHEVVDVIGRARKRIGGSDDNVRSYAGWHKVADFYNWMTSHDFSYDDIKNRIEQFPADDINWKLVHRYNRVCDQIIRRDGGRLVKWPPKTGQVA